MEGWHELWNPAAILAAAGTLGVIASARPTAQRWIAPICLLGLWLAPWSWSDAKADDLARGAITASLTWGALLIVRQSTSRFELPLQFVLLAALCLMAQAGDVVTVFLGLQLISTGVCLLGSPAGSQGRSKAAAQSPLPWLLLLGCVLLTAVTGSTRIDTISEALRTSYVHLDAANYKIAGGGSRMLTLSAALVGTALAGYAVCVPFHFQFVAPPAGGRAADFHRLAEPGTDALRLLLPRAAVLIAWAKLWPATIISTESTAQLLVGVLAAITSVVPLLQARVERSLIRQWWLLAIAQGGWLLLAITVASFSKPVVVATSARLIVEWNLPSTVQSAWWLLVMDGVALLGLFGVLEYLRRRERAIEFIEDLRGLLHFEPIAAACACVCLLSLSGLPLLAGFWGRLFIAWQAMNVRGEWGPPQLLVPHEGLLLLTLCVALSTVSSTAIALRSVWLMLFGLPLGQARPIGTVSPLFAAVLSSVILIGCGVLPGPLLNWLCAPRTAQHDSQTRPNFSAVRDQGVTR